MSLDEAKNTDVVKEVEGIKFAVDKSLDEQYKEVIVDYAKGWFSKQFIVSLKYGGSCH
ncbi:hypothetical protein SAMN05660472_02141 [Natronincola ferrireducens]|uniref:Uncharacterized protein n=1 Tax=Natronincola ferrireducens TaxID=393762 RepID=A0A1G9FBA4_9FIRM|nr:hypothetical protein [Natronincola ferrireducens]SDK85682.1 hypothetical protein SAMN05660472_02141 [Natronincola ferrireducens]